MTMPPDDHESKRDSRTPALLADLPTWIETAPADGRPIPVISHWNHRTRDWELFTRVTGGKFLRLAGGEPIIGSYFGTESADAYGDYELPIASLVDQHLTTVSVFKASSQVERNILQCGAVLEKYRLVEQAGREQRGAYTALLCMSELEYLFHLLRTTYDSLQCLTRAVAKLLYVPDSKGDYRRLPKTLPRSFADMVIKSVKGDDGKQSDAPRLTTEIGSVYPGLPEPFLDWYAAEAPIFLVLRQYRNKIAHYGETPHLVFPLPAFGLGVLLSELPWRDFTAVCKDAWRSDQLADRRFGSLRGFMASMIAHVIGATTRLDGVIRGNLALPPALNPTLRTFIRSPVTYHLVQLPRTIIQPWERVVGS